MALANTLRVLSGGFRTAWFIPIDTDGYFAGSTGSLTAGATGAGGYFINGVKAAPYKGIAPLVLLGTGEDQPLGQIIEPPQTLPSFQMTTAIGDLQLDALTQSTATFNLGNATFGAIQPYLPQYIDGALLFLRLSMSRDAAFVGVSNWDCVLFPKVKLVALSSEGFEQSKISTFAYHVICNPSTIFPNGITMGSANFKTTNAVELPFTSPNKVLFYGWKGDGATTVFNLPQSAIPGSGLLATGNPQATYKEGVLSAPSSVNLVSTNYQFTFSVAPALNARVVTLAEYL